MGSTPTWANVPVVGIPPVVLSTQITANWGANNNPAGITSYRADISQDAGFASFTPIITTNTFVTFPSLTSNTTYFMRVSAINQAGVVTTPQILASARTLPGAPGILPFTNISPSQLQANWSAPSGGSDNSYLAILSTAQSPSTNNLPSNKSASTSSTFAIFSTAINPNTLYYVDVQAINASGNSTFTSLGSTPTWANVPTVGTPPVVLSTQITANWGSNNNPVSITSYRADISQDAGFVSFTPFITTNTFVTFSSSHL